MGIPQYFKWLQTRFPGSFSDGTPRKNRLDVDNIYIDLNCFLHGAARKCGDSEDQLCRNVCREVDSILQENDALRTNLAALEQVTNLENLI